MGFATGGHDVIPINGVLLRAYRHEAGLTQKQLADRAGTHDTHISAYETGERQPSRRKLEKIAEALAVSVAALCEPDET